MSESYRLYVFDAYGTVFDVHSAVRRIDCHGADGERLSALWRSKQLEYTWVETLMGRYSDFWSLTERALDYALAALGAAPEIRSELLAAYETLEAFPEVAAVLAGLRHHGARTAILSNATAVMLAKAVRAAGLDGLFDAVLSVEELGLYKPDPRVYRLVERHLGTPPEAVSFQSSNAWDAAGAAVFGFRAVWVNRSGAPREYPAAGSVHEIASLQALLG